MKKLLVLFLTALFLTPSLSYSESDSDYQRRLIKERQKEFKGRDALRLKREEEVVVDYKALDKKNAEIRRKEKERFSRLTDQFDQVVFQELKQARRLYDKSTVSILEDEAQDRYAKTPTDFYVKARIYIHLFDAEFLRFRYNTTKVMHERPRLLKQLQDQGEIGLALLDKLQEKDIADPELWRLRAIFLSCFIEKRFSKKKYYLQSQKAFTRAIELNPEPINAKLNLAQFYMNQPKKYGRDPEAAKVLAEEVLKENPKSVDALLVLGRFYQQSFKYGLAHQNFQKAFQLEPKNPEVNFYYAIARQDKKRFKELMKF